MSGPYLVRLGSEGILKKFSQRKRVLMNLWFNDIGVCRTASLHRVFSSSIHLVIQDAFPNCLMYWYLPQSSWLYTAFHIILCHLLISFELPGDLKLTDELTPVLAGVSLTFMVSGLLLPPSLALLLTSQSFSLGQIEILTKPKSITLEYSQTHLNWGGSLYWSHTVYFTTDSMCHHI